MRSSSEQTDRSSMPSQNTGPNKDELRQGIIHTEVSPAVAWVMIVSFLAIIFGIPIQQVVVELLNRQRPNALNLFSNGRFPTRSDLGQYEDGLQEQSSAIRFCQPRLQELITAWGGFGSTNIVVGRDGWLFYRPGIDSVTGPGFLDPQTLRRHTRNWRDAAATEAVSPDPRPAILQFKRQVESAGAKLILLPIPDKASLQGHDLSWRVGTAVAAQNPSFARFIAELRAAGVEVFDPSPALIHPGEIRYLAQDTHWTPQWMDEVSLALALRVRPHLDRGMARSLRLQPAVAQGMSDLTEMLRLTEQQRLFPTQSATIQRVLDESGERLRPDAQSQVLLLGDSFTNIYSAKPMGWGDGAGLAEHLSYHLGRPIDWIARNDVGAHATREMLAGQLAQGKNRLAGKKVVIWQFAARELSLGDWRMVPMGNAAGD